MKPETLNGYRAQLRRGEALDLDQQRAVVDNFLQVLDARSGGKTAQMLAQEIRERENNMKAALVDIAEVLTEAEVYGGMPRLAAIFRARDYVHAATKMLRSLKTQHLRSWDDWKVMVDEDHGTTMRETHT